MQSEARTETLAGAIRLAALAMALGFVFATVPESPSQQPAANEWIGKRAIQRQRDLMIRPDNVAAERGQARLLTGAVKRH